MRLARLLLPAEDDLGELGQFLAILTWIMLAGGLIGVAGLATALYLRWIDGWGFLGGLLLLPVILYAIARLAHGAVAGTARGFVNTVFAAGNLQPAASFSLEEALVLQGRIAEARAALEERLAHDPDDLAVRFHLAALLRDHLADFAAAERLYREGRAQPSGRQHEEAIANRLIDLFERTGARGPLMVEYAKYADRHRGTPQGDAAKRRLLELKAPTRSP